MFNLNRNTHVHWSERKSALQQGATFLACALLMAIPFRATVGARSALLTIAATLLIIDQFKRWSTSDILQQTKSLHTLVAASALWFVLILLWSLLGPDPLNSLSTMRRDVLSPIVTFCVFFSLTTSHRDLFKWCLCIAAAQVALTVLMVLDPVPLLPSLVPHSPAYIDVGVASTWLVMVASMSPVLWDLGGAGVIGVAGQSTAMKGNAMRFLAAIFLISIVVAAIYSHNRFIWPCFASMITVGVFIHVRHLRSQTGKGFELKNWLLFLATLAALAVLTWSTVQFRASPLIGEQPINHLLHDPRASLWDTATEMISEYPLFGRGYDAAAIPSEFSDRYSQAVRMPVDTMFEHPHNTVLRYGLQMGLVGIVLVLSLFAALAITFIRLPQHLPLARLAATCGVALVTGFFVRNLVDDFFSRQSLTLFAAIAGMLLGAGIPRVNNKTG